MSIAVPINPFATLTAQSTLASLPDPGANWGRERYLNHSAGQLTTQREMIQLGGRAPAGAAVGAATSRTPSMEGAPERGQFYDGRSRCSAPCVPVMRLDCGRWRHRYAAGLRPSPQSDLAARYRLQACRPGA